MNQEKTLVCCVEEESAKGIFEAVLPQLLPNCTVKYVVFEGKQDLDRNIKKKLQGWLLPDSCFLILRDRDSGDCRTLKNDLLAKVADAGKEAQTCVRIACCELESFYLGDLKAVEEGLEIPNLAKKHEEKEKFRNPDLLGNAAEELEKLSRDRYKKLAGSRAIAPYLCLAGKNEAGANRSPSFHALLDGIAKLMAI